MFKGRECEACGEPNITGRHDEAQCNTLHIIIDRLESIENHFLANLRGQYGEKGADDLLRKVEDEREELRGSQS